jgi:dTDP-4-amino-4,6-dideoxygalactose transaminase
VLEIDPQIAGVTRDEMITILHAENILARRYFYPGCHQMEPYRSYFPHAGLLLPHTERLTQLVLCLPSGTAVDEDDIGMICSIIRTALAHPQEITEKFKTFV